MSEDNEGPGESEPKPKFRQDHYDRLIHGQKPWREFRGAWRGEDDAWKAFEKDSPTEVAAIREAIANWNTNKRPTPAMLDGADLNHMYLHGARLEGAELAGAQLVGAHLDGSNLNDAHLEGANLKGAHLVGVPMQRAGLSRADLSGANLAGADLQEAVLFGTDLRKANLLGANLKGAGLTVAHLQRANLGGSNLEGATLTGTDLAGANLIGARVGDTGWSQARISNTTKLSPLYFSPNHFALNDGSETIVLEDRDKKLNWGTIRRLGSLPLFGVSYAALSVSLLTITGIGFVNQLGGVDWWEHPIPLPDRLLWLLLSSSALAIGSTLYRVKCPERVQTFSETEWVEAHGRPRLLYIAEKIKRPWQWSTSVFLWLGAVTGGVLLLERVIVAVVYIVRDWF